MTIPKFPSIATFVIWSALIFSLCPSLFGQLTIEKKIPKNVPIQIEFVNDDSPNWFRDLNIKVTNVGNKPIRFLFLDLVLDTLAEDGHRWGFPLTFGNRSLYSTTELAKSTDISLQPSETYTFKIDSPTADAWELRLSKVGLVERCGAQLRLGWLNFGDGTGIKGGGTPFKKN